MLQNVGQSVTEQTMQTMQTVELLYNYTTALALDLSTTAPPNLEGLRTAMQNYLQVHGPLALVVCIIGIVMNVINIVVLSHPEMLSPVNRLLQAIGEYSHLLYSLCYGCRGGSVSRWAGLSIGRP